MCVIKAVIWRDVLTIQNQRPQQAMQLRGLVQEVVLKFRRHQRETPLEPKNPPMNLIFIGGNKHEQFKKLDIVGSILFIP